MEFRGLEILHNCIRQQLKSKEDCIVAALHILLINKGNKCVGTGNEWPESSTTAPTEMLPEGWNSDQEVYTLRYVSNSGIRYLVKLVKAGNSLLVNVFNVNEEKAAGMSLNIDRHVSEEFASFSTTYKDLDDLGKNFQAEIVQKVKPKSADSKKASTSDEKNRRDIEEPILPEVYANPHPLDDPQRVGFPSVGLGDLDPLGRGQGGGMLLDPAGMGIPSRPTLPEFGIGGPSGLPRGAVPPGARFDPFGPPTRGRGPSYPPNPDHFPPPGFDDFYS